MDSHVWLELGGGDHHAVIAVAFLGSFWQGIGGYSIIGFQRLTCYQP